MSPENSHTPAQAALLPALHAMQDRHGYIPTQAIAQLAKDHNVSRAEVLGVIGFYHDFRLEPPGRTRLRICRAESCQAVGGERLAEHAVERLGLDWGATSTDGRYTLEAAYCLGNCACSPAITLDGTLYGRVDPERLDALLAEKDET
ncbi:formate dehydrogenase subunit gamma [Parasulfuritortus cantonensis]|uniref:Formate dehydrogenase subunit gamma n=1 Tax=Parasulfuritortus cantonensis TaxID=2528202 RepID=A0A4R1B1L0_9PROT|nr:formate dehydrogenase subunit gamma [Parasulfuritortus cantonensis]TCJ11912.1 formate dehydrogenase subunit gamma [Parasulfuritortus cantonensis]